MNPKHNHLLGWVCVLLLGAILSANGQTSYTLSAKYTTGKAHNLFYAPDEVISKKGFRFPTDTLIHSDLFHRADLIFRLKNKMGKRHYWQFYHNTRVIRYMNIDQANQSRYIVRPSYAFKISKKLKAGATITGARVNKLAVNVLGDELLKNYAHYHLSGQLRLIVKPFRGNLTIFKAARGIKEYDRKADEVTLTHEYTFLEGKISQKVGRHDRMRASISLTNRDYTEWIIAPMPEDPLLDIPPDSVAVSWRYIHTQFSYRKDLFSRGYITPYFKWQQKEDMSGGDFSYFATRLGVKLGMSFGKMEILLNGYREIRTFADRLARQLDGEEGPQLIYRYYRIQCMPRFHISESLTVMTGVEYLRRMTNTSDLSRKYRRPFMHYRVFAGIHYRLDGKI